MTRFRRMHIVPGKVELFDLWSIWSRKSGASEDQFSILRIWAKVKLHRAVLLGFGLKELKIGMNIVKLACTLIYQMCI